MSPVAAATGFNALSSPFHYNPPFSLLLNPHPPIFLKSRWVQHYNSRLLLVHPLSSLSTKSQGVVSCRTSDPELRLVLELATDSELYEIERILFGPSYFSPLLKSVTKRADIDHVMIGEDLEERQEYISMLESRFLFLAADARSTLRGWRPSYRNVLLSVRKELNIPCSAKLSTEDLEAEIFLYLLQEYSRDEAGICGANENLKSTNEHSNLEQGLSQWKVQVATAFRGGAADLRSVILKGGGMFTLRKIYELLATRLSGKMFQEAAKYQINKELIKKGGQLAAINLESRAAMLAAKQGVAGAASCYLGLRSMMTLLGPMWRSSCSFLSLHPQNCSI